MESNQFFQEMDKVFEKQLKVNKIVIVKSDNESEVVKLNYSKVLFDSDLNIWKKDDTGTFIKVDSKDYKAKIIEL